MSRGRVLERLGSPRLAAALIVVLIGMTLLGVVLPQQGYFGEQFEQFERDAPWLAAVIGAVGLDRLFTGWAVIVVATLLALNVTACSIVRLRSRARPPRPRATRDALTGELAAAVTSDDYLDRAAGALTAGRFRVVARTPDGVVARAGAGGFWGSMLLHASLLVIIVGGAATAATSFRGEMVIADGQTVLDAPESYLAVTNEPEIGAPYSGARITVEDSEVRYQDGTVVSAVARMRAMTPAGATVRKDVRVNHPLDVAGKSYLLQNSGYAVALAIAMPGAEAQTLVVNLARRLEDGWSDSIVLGPAGGRTFALEMRATPVPIDAGDPLPAEEYDLVDPRLYAAITADGAVVWEGALAEGEQVAPVDGLTLTFEELRLWNRFLVRGEPGRWITYVGFWLAVAGAAWRFAVPERRISVLVTPAAGGRTVSVSRRSRPWTGWDAERDAGLAGALVALAGEETTREDGAADDGS